MRKVFKIIMPLIIVCFSASGWAVPTKVDDKKFDEWKEVVRAEALSEGVSQTMFDEAMAKVKPDGRIVKLDGQQPHRTIGFSEYLARAVSRSRVKRGVKLMRENDKLLKEVSQKYGVQPRFIIALWGIETDYGRNTGGFYVPEALTTLAYDGRRADFFRKELIESLKILEGKHVTIKNMKGSWAGAMGQSQFMPSSFFKFAQDYNGDGRKDIWTTKSDVFASIANYLSQTKWDDTTTWGRKVMLPEDFEIGIADSKQYKNIKEWQKLGVRKSDGSNLPRRDIAAAIALPGGDVKNAYMVYGNYKTLLDWNRSLYFATAVGLLSDAIARR